VSDPPSGLTDDEQLLFVLTGMADEQPMRAGTETELLADRLGWTPQQVDLSSLRLEPRGLVTRINTMNGKQWTTFVAPTNAAFLWRARTDPGWPAVFYAAVEHLMGLGPGGGVGSRQVADATGMHERAARALVYEWQAAGAVRNAHPLMPIGVVAHATGLRP